jgi:hypothetical protein
MVLFPFREIFFLLTLAAEADKRWLHKHSTYREFIVAVKSLLTRSIR